jgi:hypothetical protein
MFASHRSFGLGVGSTAIVSVDDASDDHTVASADREA